MIVGGLLVDAELTARLATAGEEELTTTFTRLKPQFSALLTHNQVACCSVLVSVQQKRPEISQRRNISRRRRAD
jgi:hypothetical protein